MLTDLCPACPLDLTVTGINPDYPSNNRFDVDIKNLSEMPLRMAIPLTTYRTSAGLELDGGWYGGLSDLEVKREILIRPKTIKRGMLRLSAAIPRVSEKGVLFTNVMLPDLRMQYFINFRYACAKPFDFPVVSVEQKEVEQREHASRRSSETNLYNDNEIEITSNVERLELIEEKLGINITGIYAFFKTLDGGRFYIGVNFDVSSSNGEPLKQSISIRATAYNEIGQAIGMSSTSVNNDDFLGFDSKSIIFLTDQPPEKIRLFPTK